MQYILGTLYRISLVFKRFNGGLSINFDDICFLFFVENSIFLNSTLNSSEILYNYIHHNQKIEYISRLLSIKNKSKKQNNQAIIMYKKKKRIKRKISKKQINKTQKKKSEK